MPTVASSRSCVYMPIEAMAMIRKVRDSSEPSAVTLFGRDTHQRVLVQHALDHARVEDLHLAGRRKLSDLAVDRVEVLGPAYLPVRLFVGWVESVVAGCPWCKCNRR
jgi:hypothetical protein